MPCPESCTRAQNGTQELPQRSPRSRQDPDPAQARPGGLVASLAPWSQRQEGPGVPSHATGFRLVTSVTWLQSAPLWAPPGPHGLLNLEGVWGAEQGPWQAGHWLEGRGCLGCLSP